MSKDEIDLGQIAGEGIETERGEYRNYFEKDPRGFTLIHKMYDPQVEVVRGRNKLDSNTASMPIVATR